MYCAETLKELCATSHTSIAGEPVGKCISETRRSEANAGSASLCMGRCLSSATATIGAAVFPAILLTIHLAVLLAILLPIHLSVLLAVLLPIFTPILLPVLPAIFPAVLLPVSTAVFSPIFLPDVGLRRGEAGAQDSSYRHDGKDGQTHQNAGLNKRCWLHHKSSMRA